jgi:saccharopine dehydrogenase (NAD+, L-lysine forming)
VGCELVPSNTFYKAPTDTFILGLKELPNKDKLLEKLENTHIYFAHCFKYQPNWKETLSRFVPNGLLLDLEFLTYDNGNR